jgi:hypothetical protein
MAALAGAGCGGRPAAPPPAQPLEIATPRPEPENGAAPLATHARGAPDFAPSSLTAFANQVTVVVGEVLDGRQPSRSPLPLAPSRDSEPLLKSRAPAPTPRFADLEFIVFGMELEIVLTEDGGAPVAAPGAAGQPPAAAPSAQPEAGRLASIVFLSRSGLKIAKLDARGASRSHAVPAALEGAKKFATEIFEAARRGNLESLFVGEPERQVLANDALFAQLLKDRPDREALDRVQALAASRREPIGSSAAIWVWSRPIRARTWSSPAWRRQGSGRPKTGERPGASSAPVPARP